MTWWSVFFAVLAAQLTGLLVGLAVGFGAGVWWGARNVDIVVETDRLTKEERDGTEE